MSKELEDKFYEIFERLGYSKSDLFLKGIKDLIMIFVVKMDDENNKLKQEIDSLKLKDSLRFF